VLVDSQQGPKRQWLEPSLNILFTHRARAKVAGYFRARDQADLVRSGRQLLIDFKRKLDLPQSDADFIASCMSHAEHTQEPFFLAAVAIGEISYIQLLAQVLESLESSITVAPQRGLPGMDTPELPSVATLQVVAVNRAGLLNDITQLLAAWKVSLMGASGRVSNSSEQAIITLEAELDGGRQLLQIMSLIVLLKGVEDVIRLSTKAP
jgi:(p)ppGpp synthase/HD superfamily hydrolase